MNNHLTDEEVLITCDGAGKDEKRRAMAAILTRTLDDAANQHAALQQENAELRKLLGTVPLDYHKPDEQGECLCGQCEFRRKAAEVLARHPAPRSDQNLNQPKT